MNTPEKKLDLRTRIEDLWLEAAANLPENRAVSEAPSDEGDFERIRASFEAVSKLQPPPAGQDAPAGSESPFGKAFDALVRSIVRDYIDNELEDSIRRTLRSELEAGRGGRPDA